LILWKPRTRRDRGGDDAVHLNDLNATILHLMGINHRAFTYKFQGLDQRLTGVEGSKVVKGILA
jgi:hypothetical protein